MWYSAPYDLLFLCRLLSRIMNSVSIKTQALLPEYGILSAHTDILNEIPDRGRVTWEWQWELRMSHLPNNCTTSVFLPCPSTLISWAMRALLSALTSRNSVWPASTRERKDTNSGTLTCYQMMVALGGHGELPFVYGPTHAMHAQNATVTHGKERRHDFSSPSTFPMLSYSLLSY